jgi:hypothetical protein
MEIGHHRVSLWRDLTGHDQDDGRINKAYFGLDVSYGRAERSRSVLFDCIMNTNMAWNCEYPRGSGREPDGEVGAR